MKILIADDDKALHDMYSEFLSQKGYEVFHAYDGKEALEESRTQMPDLILLDLHMPEVDGRDVCKALREDPATKHMVIVILTGRDQQWDRVAGLELGADEYVTKPCDLAYLDHVITSVMRKMPI